MNKHEAWKKYKSRLRSIATGKRQTEANERAAQVVAQTKVLHDMDDAPHPAASSSSAASGTGVALQPQDIAYAA